MSQTQTPAPSGQAPVAGGRVLSADGSWADNTWHVVREGEASEATDTPTLWPLVQWLERKAQGTLPANAGVWLAPADDPAALNADFARLPLVAVDFPRFFDGRGYSTASLLRRHGYTGELRAIGEVLIDQIFHLKRVGFDSFVPREDQNAAHATAALQRYSETYQGATDNPVPLFRRRAASLRTATGS
ncbi:MAG TPA: DUF934 domain-containing protein [Burkholderiaceae bacterium]|nr:DUF934 domain-containing protein [Burkholderiaceae bacterium]